MNKEKCSVCTKLIEKGGLSMEGKRFCCIKCYDHYIKKHPPKKNVCEFC